jgi:hypothetical protein
MLIVQDPSPERGPIPGRKSDMMATQPAERELK